MRNQVRGRAAQGERVVCVCVSDRLCQLHAYWTGNQVVILAVYAIPQVRYGQYDALHRAGILNSDGGDGCTSRPLRTRLVPPMAGQDTEKTMCYVDGVVLLV